MSLGGIDEWLKSEIRLADRQGLLTGRHLSVIQFQATYLLNWIDETDKSAAGFQALKRSLIASGSWKPQDLFPEHFDDTATVVEDDLSEELPSGADIDYSKVEWKSPTGAKDEYEALMAQVSQFSQGKLDEHQVRVPGDDGWR